MKNCVSLFTLRFHLYVRCSRSVHVACHANSSSRSAWRFLTSVDLTKSVVLARHAFGFDLNCLFLQLLSIRPKINGAKSRPRCVGVAAILYCDGLVFKPTREIGENASNWWQDVLHPPPHASKALVGSSGDTSTLWIVAISPIETAQLQIMTRFVCYPYATWTDGQ